MSLANLLSAEQIIPEMKATERWSAIVELTDLLVRITNRLPDFPEGSIERANALVTLRNIRRVLTLRHDLTP